MAEITTREQRVANYAEEYKQNCRHTPYWRNGWPHLHPPLPPAAEAYEKLAALGAAPSPDAVDEIMGSRVSYATCDECGEEAAVVAKFDVYCGDFSVEICAPCCEALARRIWNAAG